MNDELTTQLRRYDPLVGRWWTEMAHRALPETVRGTVDVEWLEGGAYLLQRSRTDHPEVPDAVTVLGPDADGEELRLEYFDSRGVRRTYVPSFDGTTWRLESLVSAFPQRFAGTVADDGQTIDGVWQLIEDATWVDDARVTYRR